MLLAFTENDAAVKLKKTVNINIAPVASARRVLFEFMNIDVSRASGLDIGVLTAKD
jgi:hypothetical protein